MAVLKGEGGERRYSINASAEEQGAVGHPNKALENVRRSQPMMADTTESDEEEVSYNGCCLLQSRSMKGARYSRLESDDLEASAKPNAKAKFPRSRSVFTEIWCCCCGSQGAPTNYTTVEVRSVLDTKQDRKWEVNVNEDYCKPSYWRQAVRKLASHGHARRPSRGADWLGYDAHEYQMNFDDGCCGRDNCVSYLFTDQKDDSATRARAMHDALLKKFAANGSTTSSAPRSPPVSPILSPLPVKMRSKEEIGKSKEGFVPIWQRRQGVPPVKLDLRQRSGPMD